MLYDKSFCSQHLEPGPDDVGPLLAYLCASADPAFIDLRDRIERWFAAAPQNMQERIGPKLLSSDDSQFLSYLYELCAAEYLRTRKWNVEYEPNGPCTSPDFKAQKKDHCVSIEVFAVFDAEEEVIANKKVNQLTKALNQRVKSDRRILVSTPNPNALQHVDALAGDIQRWVDTLPAGSGSSNTRLSGPYGGLALQVSDSSGGALPRPVQPISTGMRGTNTVTRRIEDRLRDKAKKFDLSVADPQVIVASGGYQRTVTPSECLVEALWGRIRSTYYLDTGQSQVYKQKDGLFYEYDLKDPSLGRWRAVSAVLWSQLYRHQNRLGIGFAVFHNPQAVVPIDRGLFGDLPQFGPQQPDASHLYSTPCGFGCKPIL